ncbi:hypothetical protein ABVV53_05920 [Novosphingobium sp. RD2P27]|uniref:Lipoprotein n=1 Tax=Novosphingobium kalidii TaxID=3230299 RepID=A0ABV2CZF7_9SPHN
MKTSTRLAIACAASAMLLFGGCKSETKSEPNGAEDPAITGALGDEIMVDPEMSGANGSAIAPNGGQTELPPEQRSPEAIQAARDEAMVQAGGSLKATPQPQTGSPTSLVESAATAARVAQQAKAASTDCTQKVQYSATWAAKLPKDLPVYPRGAVQEAAGTDGEGCSLRVVNFVSPVTPGDVMDFYYTKATNAGFGAEHRMDGSDHVLGGRKGNVAYLIYARALDNGLTEVDLIASGH